MHRLSRRLLIGLALVAPCGCASRAVKVSVIPPFLSSAEPALLWQEPFDALDLARWQDVEVHGRTAYRLATLEGRSCLQAQSQASASILLSSLRFDPHVHQWLSWEWRVDQLVEGEALERKDGSDAAARLYVYFETRGLPWQKRSLDYVWSASLPVGTVLESAYSSASKIIVAESGAAALGQWRRMKRNLEEDYRRAFREAPPHVVAIGLMTDTDNTRSHALAYFDDLRISRTAPRTNPSRP